MKYKSIVSGLVMSSFFFASCGEKKTTNTDAKDDPAVVKNSGTYEPTTAVAKELVGKTVILKGGELVETQLVNADYYFLYFTASW